MSDNIYYSLDEAREELKKRWNNPGLKKKIEDELGEKMLPIFEKGPRAILNRQVCSPDNGYNFLYYCAKYIGAEPLAWEDVEDIFVSFNEEKKGLGRLRVVLENGSRGIIDIMDCHENEKRKLNECILRNGEKLVDFHHRLIDVCQYKMDIYDDPAWAKKISDVDNYYYVALLHFIAHGVLFETFSLDEREKGEADFVDRVVVKNIKKVEEKFNLKPLIVRLYPEDQSDDEDFYWWSYPPSVNDYLVRFARENGMLIKDLN